MFKLKNKNLNPSVVRAFSIGEVILSVFILGVTMITILSLYSKGLREFQDERDSVVASLLAQEGVELARNIRDNNWADRTCALCTSPNTFDNFPASDEPSARLDTNDASISSNSDFTLRYVSGFYLHDAGGAGVKFRRRITLVYDGGNASGADDVIITSFVSWNNSNPPTDIGSCKTANKCSFSQETLTDWGTGT